MYDEFGFDHPGFMPLDHPGFMPLDHPGFMALDHPGFMPEATSMGDLFDSGGYGDASWPGMSFYPGLA